jgi:hypothetical protein
MAAERVQLRRGDGGRLVVKQIDGPWFQARGQHEWLRTKPCAPSVLQHAKMSTMIENDANLNACDI